MTKGSLEDNPNIILYFTPGVHTEERNAALKFIKSSENIEDIRIKKDASGRSGSSSILDWAMGDNERRRFDANIIRLLIEKGFFKDYKDTKIVSLIDHALVRNTEQGNKEHCADIFHLLLKELIKKHKGNVEKIREIFENSHKSDKNFSSDILYNLPRSCLYSTSISFEYCAASNFDTLAKINSGILSSVRDIAKTAPVNAISKSVYGYLSRYVRDGDETSSVKDVSRRLMLEVRDALNNFKSKEKVRDAGLNNFKSKEIIKKLDLKEYDKEDKDYIESILKTIKRIYHDLIHKYKDLVDVENSEIEIRPDKKKDIDDVVYTTLGLLMHQFSRRAHLKKIIKGRRGKIKSAMHQIIVDTGFYEPSKIKSYSDSVIKEIIEEFGHGSELEEEISVDDIPKTKILDHEEVTNIIFDKLRKENLTDFKAQLLRVMNVYQYEVASNKIGQLFRSVKGTVATSVKKIRERGVNFFSKQSSATNNKDVYDDAIDDLDKYPEESYDFLDEEVVNKDAGYKTDSDTRTPLNERKAVSQWEGESHKVVTNSDSHIIPINEISRNSSPVPEEVDSNDSDEELDRRIKEWHKELPKEYRVSGEDVVANEQENEPENENLRVPEGILVDLSQTSEEQESQNLESFKKTSERLLARQKEAAEQEAAENDNSKSIENSKDSEITEADFAEVDAIFGQLTEPTPSTTTKPSKETKPAKKTPAIVPELA